MRFSDDQWSEKKLSDLFAPIRNGFVGIATPFYTTKEQGVRYLQSTNIHDGSIGDETCIYITKDFHQAHIKNELKETDILMVQSGHSGECAVVGKKYAGCNCHALIIMSSLGLSDSRFVCDYLNGVGKAKTKILLTGNTVKHILASDVKDIRIMVPPIASQKRISDFMSLLTQRIQVQNKIIEELISSEESIIDAVFSQQENGVLSDFIDETSNRNKGNEPLTVFSVSNKLGFIPQSEQFEEKEVASANKRNYKVVSPPSFAYNPARINVGSIGFYSGETPVIISPMYVCFRARNINPTILTLFFKSKAFFKEMSSKLEGSVRQCLTFQGMKSIKLHVPSAEDTHWLAFAKTIREKRITEEKILQNYLAQKQFLLRNLFI